MIAITNGARGHRRRVRTTLRLGEPEASDELAFGQFGEPPVLLRFATEGVNRVHAQRALNRCEGTQRGVGALELAQHDSVGDVASAAAAVSGEVRAQNA